MAAPIGAHVGEWLKTMWDSMIDLLFIRIGFGIRLADALRNHLLVTTLVAGILAICALHTSRVLEEVTTERATHYVVECLRGEFVAILLDHVFLLLPDCTFTTQTYIESFPLLDLFDEAES